MPSRPKRKPELFMSPAGAGIVLICFFLPWIRASCHGKEIVVSGASAGGSLWLVFGISAIVLALFLLLTRTGKEHRSWVVMLAGSVISLGTIIYNYVIAVQHPDKPFYVPASAIDVELKPGAVGTILGLLMIFAGGILVKRARPEQGSGSPESVQRPAEKG